LATLVIPARFGSKRLPGKPLLSETGTPMILHVVERARRASLVRRVIVATDDERIRDAVEEGGGEAAMTEPTRTCGTERVAEIATGLPDETTFVNLQGDEPEIDPADLDFLIRVLEESGRGMATLAAPLGDEAELAEPSAVKVVLKANGDALYFGRAPIPHDRDGDGPARPLRHLGVYGFTRETVLRYLELRPSPLEATERLEQLRALENGIDIRVAVVRAAPPGIDTIQDYRAFVRRHAAGEE